MFTYVYISGAWPENRLSTNLTSMALRSKEDLRSDLIEK
jgi:hypothetical protein